MKLIQQYEKTTYMFFFYITPLLLCSNAKTTKTDIFNDIRAENKVLPGTNRSVY